MPGLVALGVLALVAQDARLPVVMASDAGRVIGQTRTVCGVVRSVQRDGPGSRAATLLQLHTDAPAPPVWIELADSARRLYPDDFERRAATFQVCAEGAVQQQPSGFRIVITDGTAMRAAVHPSSVPSEFAPGVLRLDRARAGIAGPVVRREVKPKYTQAGMRAQITGQIELLAVVKADGTVGDVLVTKSIDALFGMDEAGVDALRQWRFTPATRDGQPLDVVVTVILEFRLR